jgi:hypothetical protein
MLGLRILALQGEGLRMERVLFGSCSGWLMIFEDATGVFVTDAELEAAMKHERRGEAP